MFHQTKKERNQRQFRAYVVPAAILAGWMSMVGAVFASVSGRPSLQNSIEMVLSAPGTAQPSTPVQLAQR